MTVGRSNRFVAIIHLTRWREHLPFTVPLTVTGALLSRHALDWRLVPIIAANMLAVSYAFMVNDIEDASDDLYDAARAARNSIASGEISPRAGWIISGVVALLAVMLYASGGLWVFGIGVATLLLCHIYSWKRVRLKAWPVADVASHALMLSGLLLMAGYFLYDTAPGPTWLLVAAVSLFSAHGQLYNQLRDLNMDRAAGLNNTTRLVGASTARVLTWLCAGGGMLLLGSAVATRALPLWFLAALMTLFLAAVLAFRRHPDMRGDQAADANGEAQVPFLFAANLSVALWLAYRVYLIVGGTRIVAADG